jgi:hypothetical protein
VVIVPPVHTSGPVAGVLASINGWNVPGMLPDTEHVPDTIISEAMIGISQWPRLAHADAILPRKPVLRSTIT